MSADPPDFLSWPIDRRNAFSEAEASTYRERKTNGHGNRAIPEPVPPRVQLICASTIRPEPVSWLWRGWLARGKLHIIGGQPGAGKTTLAMLLAAIVSAGRRWPDGTVAQRGNVVIWSGEDDPADTLTPRLAASGADLGRIYIVSGMVDGSITRPFDPARDVEPLAQAIKEIGGASLIIVDPIISAVNGDSHKNAETRRCLQPLVDLAADVGAALLGITHFSKGTSGREPVERINGSIAFGALARVVMVAVTEQPGEDGNPGRRIFARAKSNIGPDEGGFAYSLELMPMPGHPEIEASITVFGERIEGTAREMLAAAEAEPDDRREASSLDEAKAFLIDLVAAGSVPSKAVKAEITGAGIAWRTVRRAQDKLRIKPRKESGEWVWSLPQGGQGVKQDDPHLNLRQDGQVGQVRENQQVEVVQRGQGGQGVHLVQDFGAGHLGGLAAPGTGPTSDELTERTLPDGAWEGEI
jgi:putative DNA primase/helicase